MAGKAFASTGLAPSYAFLLMTVNEKPGIQPKEISLQMQLSPSTITRLIEKMEQQNFLERKIEGKYTRVFPTNKSLALDPTIRDAWMDLFSQYTNLLGEQESKLLTLSVYNASKKLET